MTEQHKAHIDEALELAKLYADQEDREAHIVELLKPYLKKRESDGYAWFLYGDALRVIGRLQEAWAALQRALELTPEADKWTVCARIGMLCTKCRSLTEAEEWFRRATQSTDSPPGWLLVMRGANLAVMGHYVDALECHRAALIAEDIDKDEVYVNIGYVLRAMGKYAEATAAFHKALSICPDESAAKTALDGLKGIESTMESASLI